MKTSLSYLPENNQLELQRIVEIIREEIELDMLILFGSYARGDWVEDLDPETLQYRYQSDFDLLIITETRREGIVLFDSGKFTLAEPREISPNERAILANEDFEYWFGKAHNFLKIYRFCFIEGDFAEAAFNLHQTTERLYGAILLVFTRYKPNTHDLAKLGQRVASAEPQFLTVFPQGTEEEQTRFKLLGKAYVDARYKPSFTITPVELEWLAERVHYLQVLTEKLCKAKIASFV